LKPIKALFILAILSTFTSCIPLKDVKYIQPDEKLKLNENGMIEINRPEYRFQKDDFISIRISARDGVSMDMLQSFVTQGSGLSQGSGVRINDDGDIELPRIGKIHVEGLTVKETRAVIEEKFYEIFNSEAVYIEVAPSGIDFTIVGEAGNGIFSVPKHELTLLEAFAMAGSLGDVADRKHIQILRTTPEGAQRVEVDITTEAIMNSEYFWVQPNDIIIVNPRRQKQWGIGLNPVQAVATVFGALTTIIGIYFFFKNL